MHSALSTDKSFSAMMPLGVYRFYLDTMKFLAKKQYLEYAVSVIKDRGIYTLNFVDKYGEDVYKIAFLKGIRENASIYKNEDVALFPFTSISKEELALNKFSLEKCLSEISPLKNQLLRNDVKKDAPPKPPAP